MKDTLNHDYSPDVTGGVYKAQKHSPWRADPRLLTIPTSCKASCSLQSELRYPL